MKRTDEIIMKVESSWIESLKEKELIPGEFIHISLNTPPKSGMLVFVSNCDRNYITYYQEGLVGHVYLILSIRKEL